MSPCPEWVDALAEPAPPSPALAKHIASCAACRVVHAEYQFMDAFLQELPVLQAPPLIEPRFLERYPRLIRHEEPPAIFSLLADRLTWRMVYELVRGDFRLSELARLVHASPARVARHLEFLRELGLVKAHSRTANKRETSYRVDSQKLADLLLEAGRLVHLGLISRSMIPRLVVLGSVVLMSDPHDLLWMREEVTPVSAA